MVMTKRLVMTKMLGFIPERLLMMMMMMMMMKRLVIFVFVGG